MTNRRAGVTPPKKPIEPENEVFKIGAAFDKYWFFAIGLCAGAALMMIAMIVVVD